MHNKSLIAAFSFVVSIGGWFLWNILLSLVFADNTIYSVKHGILHRFGTDPAWWLVYIFTVAATLLLDVAFITIRVAIWPTDVDTFQEIEQNPELRKRLEEAASSELQQGWNRAGKDKDKDKDKKNNNTTDTTAEAKEKNTQQQPTSSTSAEEGRGKRLGFSNPNYNSTSSSLDDEYGARIKGLDEPRRSGFGGEPRSSLHMCSIERRSLAQARGGGAGAGVESMDDINAIVAKRFGAIKK